MRGRAQHRRDERGAAMVEFAFVGVILVLLVFGIITFGLLLSFKQDVTRAAAEGARVGAVAQPPAVAPPTQADDNRYDVTLTATEEAVDSFGKTCGIDGMTCDVIVHDCGTTPVPSVTTYWDNGVDDCVTVELIYDYDAFPLIVEPPLLSSAMPDRISSKSVVRLNQ